MATGGGRAAPIVLDGRPDGRAPLDLGPRVTLYVCGITPYDAAHLGHAFTYVVFDTLARFLRRRGHQVDYCQNVTDVDDDVLRKAAELGVDYLELGRRETAAYLRDMAALNVAPPTWFPKATQEVPSMLELARRLVDGGHAYVVGGTVFFDVTTFPSFGGLSGYDEAEQRVLLAERGGDPDDPRKRHPLDFVVWQASAPGEPSWDSPWGPGRPGWHLECSAMSRRYLGVTIDLHGGGADLLYPHHESERAQSESANRARFVRRWMHVGMVRHEGEKMSKSLGNLVWTRELCRDHDPAAVRLALLAHHWQTAWEYEAGELKQAAERLDAWRRAAGGHARPGGRPGGRPGPPGRGRWAGQGATGPGLAGRRWPGRQPGELPDGVEAALAANLDTPAALTEVDRLAAAGDGRAVVLAAEVLGVDLAGAAGRTAARQSG